MATVPRLPVSATVDHDALTAHLAQLARLELELGVAETRQLVRRLVVTVAVALPAAVALIAALVTLLAGVLAPLYDARGEPLVIAGGAVLLLALAALGWSAWRLTHLSWPKETMTSFAETWRWLAAQLRSRLTLRSPAA